MEIFIIITFLIFEPALSCLKAQSQEEEKNKNMCDYNRAITHVAGRTQNRPVYLVNISYWYRYGCIGRTLQPI